MQRDIESREDVERLVDAFYQDVVKDEVIGVFFTEVVALDWDVHIPIMYDFWETTLLGAMKYKRNAMLKHIELDAKKPLQPAHFDRWIMLWERAVQTHFQGEKATMAIERAKQIGELMKYKISTLNNTSS